jgi:hypothetical protein
VILPIMCPPSVVCHAQTTRYDVDVSTFGG